MPSHTSFARNVIKRSDLLRLGYGAANLGNLYRELDDHQAWSVLEAAWESGIRYYDTAPHYGLGLSERRLGTFLATKPRHEYIVSTKVGRLLRPTPNAARALDVANDFAVAADYERIWDFSADGIRRSLEASLERLGLDRVDILYLHDPEKHDLGAARLTAYPALLSLRDEKLADAVGVGSMSIDALADAARVPGLDLLMIAGRLTLVDPAALGAVIPLAQRNEIEVVAAGVFNSGLLATATPGSRFEYGAAPDAVLARAQAIATVAAAHGVDLPTVALQYPLRIDSVISVVVGGSRPDQVAENAKRMTTPVPPELWSRLTTTGLIP